MQKEQKKSRKEQSRKEQKNSLCQWVPRFMFSAAAVSFVLMVISIIFYQHLSTRPPSHRTTKLFRLQWGFLYGIFLLMMAVLALDFLSCSSKFALAALAAMLLLAFFLPWCLFSFFAPSAQRLLCFPAESFTLLCEPSFEAETASYSPAVLFPGGGR